MPLYFVPRNGAIPVEMIPSPLNCTDQRLVHIGAGSRSGDAGCSDQCQRQLTELIRRAEAGEEVVLTRHGRAVVRLVPVEAAVAPAARRKLLEAVRASGPAKAEARGKRRLKPKLPLWAERTARMIAVDTSALRECVIDAVLHQDAVGADAGLAGIAVFPISRRSRPLPPQGQALDIGVVKDDERRAG